MTSVASPRRIALGQMLSWPPEGAGDFADVAWVVAQALGNGAGVRGLEVRRFPSGVSVHVTTTSPEYVRSAAAGFGWELYEPDPSYANTWGEIGEVRVDVTWIEPAADDLATPERECGW